MFYGGSPIAIQHKIKFERDTKWSLMYSLGSIGFVVSEKHPVGPTRNKNCVWRPWFLTDWDEMSNLYRGPSIDASYLIFNSFGKAVSEKI